MSIELCNQCGLCKAHCPMYKTLSKETYSPRGQLTIIKENVISEKLSNCLNCELCKVSCPSGIDVSKEVKKARVLLVSELNENDKDKELVKKLRESGNIYGIQNNQ